ncbi:hypothetical protein ACIBQ1_02665 [Nonomuraea sp. NPDC050153]
MMIDAGSVEVFVVPVMTTDAGSAEAFVVPIKMIDASPCSYPASP